MRRAVLSLALLACNSQGGLPGPSGESGPQGPVGAMGPPGKDGAAAQGPYRSGSRLEVRWQVFSFEDGTQLPNKDKATPLIFDTQLGTYCRPQQMTDDVIRCAPYPLLEPQPETATIDSYLDNRCSVPVAYGFVKEKPPRYAATLYEAKVRVFAINTAIPPPARVYINPPACNQAETQLERLYYTVGRELQPKEFVAAQSMITN